MNRVFLVTDQGMEKTSYVSEIQALLQEKGIGVQVFSRVCPNPHRSVVAQGLEKARAFQPQALIALGGGSVLDTAKAMGIWYTNPEQELWELANPQNRLEAMLPVITIPTTAGTGSEVSSWAVITNPLVPEKVSIGGQGMAPILALVDPVLTMSLPEDLTLWTGLDAMTHALEAFMAPGAHSFIQSICLHALQGISASLPIALEDGKDLKAREEVMLGSLLAGWAMENAGLGLIHGMSHPVSAYYDYPHGLTNALLLPYVLEFNRGECGEEYSQLSHSLFGDGDLVGHIQAFYQNLGFSPQLEIKEADLLRLSTQALENINTQGNPRPVDLESIMGLYRQAFSLGGT